MACKQKNNAILLQMSALAYDGDHASKVVVIKPALGFAERPLLSGEAQPGSCHGARPGTHA